MADKNGGGWALLTHQVTTTVVPGAVKVLPELGSSDLSKCCKDNYCEYYS